MFIYICLHSCWPLARISIKSINDIAILVRHYKTMRTGQSILLFTQILSCFLVFYEMSKLKPSNTLCIDKIKIKLNWQLDPY